MSFWKGFEKQAMKQVATVGIFNGTKLLMGKRRDNGKWTNTGGHMDEGESPEDGAKREAFEESGIKLDQVEHVRTQDITKKDGEKLKIHAFAAHLPEGAKPTVKHDPDAEVQRWRWIETQPKIPDEVMSNLHSPKNVLLQGLGLQKEAVSVKWMLEHLKGGIKSRRSLSDRQRKIVERTLKPTSMDGSLRAHPSDNLATVRHLNKSIHKQQKRLRPDEAISYMEMA